MSSLRNITTSVVLAPYFGRQGLFRDKPFVLVDIGSRGGIERHWRVFGNDLRVLGFDADASECERLNRKNNRYTKHFPYALGERDGVYPFYKMRNAASCSFYKPNAALVSRFPDHLHLQVERATEIRTTTLDSVLKQHKLTDVDFIKLDIEGSELSVLKGAIETLRMSVIGLQVEVLFSELLEGAPNFSEVDAFLKSNGFHLFDLGLVRLGSKGFFALPGPKRSGQIVGGHVLYMRDVCDGQPLSAHIASTRDKTKLFKIAACLEIFGLPDCAHEVLEVARDEQVISREEFAVISSRMYRKFKHDNTITKRVLSEIKAMLRRIASRGIQGLRALRRA